MAGCKYVKDFEFPASEGFTASAGKQMVKGYARGGACYAEGGGALPDRDGAAASGSALIRRLEQVRPGGKKMSQRARDAMDREGTTLVREVVVPRPKPVNRAKGGKVGAAKIGKAMKAHGGVMKKARGGVVKKADGGAVNPMMVGAPAPAPPVQPPKTPPTKPPKTPPTPSPMPQGLPPQMQQRMQQRMQPALPRGVPAYSSVPRVSAPAAAMAAPAMKRGGGVKKK
jgi:hypothetical protein